MRKRDVLRKAMTFLGVTPLRWSLLSPGLYCFNYHRLGDPQGTEHNRSVFSCSPERFEQHLELIKRRFEVLNLEQLSVMVQGRTKARRPHALITFDDGYLDNYEIAFPLLKKHGLSAVFFLPTAFIGSTALPWWEELPWLLRQAKGQTIHLASGNQTFIIEEGEAGERSILRIVRFVKSRPTPVEEQLAEIRQQCEPWTRNRANQTRLFLNWDEVREMHAAGMEIGSHTHTHQLLGHLDPREQLLEMQQSKSILEAQTGAPIRSIAYPVGKPGAYTPVTCELACTAGYEMGFNFALHGNRLPLSSPFDIGRFAVSNNLDNDYLRAITCFPGLFAE